MHVYKSLETLANVQASIGIRRVLKNMLGIVNDNLSSSARGLIAFRQGMLRIFQFKV